MILGNSEKMVRPRRFSAKPGHQLDKEQIAANKRYDAVVEDTSCNENFHQYLLNSTLHGLRYVGETNISIFERFIKITHFK